MGEDEAIPAKIRAAPGNAKGPAFLGTPIQPVNLGHTPLIRLGSTKLDTFALALMSRGFEASASGQLVGHLDDTERIAASPSPIRSDLAEHAAKLHRKKYDPFFPDALLKATLANKRLDPESVPGVARLVKIEVLDAQS